MEQNIPYIIINKVTGEIYQPTDWTSDQDYMEFVVGGQPIRFTREEGVTERLENDSYVAEFTNPTPATHAPDFPEGQ